MRKHQMQVQFALATRNPERDIRGSVIVSVADNTRWDVIQAAIIQLMQQVDVVLPTHMTTWVLNGTPQYATFSSINTTCVFKLPLEHIRYLKSTDMQIALGKYSITKEGYL